MKIYGSIADLIGRTPIIRLSHLSRATGAEILVKAEFLNPGGSMKDRVALAMLVAAEKAGTIKPGGLLVEATAGNTGIGLAMLAAARGYRFIAVMTDSDRGPKSEAMEAYGAEVVFARSDAPWDSNRGPLGVARELAQAHGGLFLNQFANPANPEAHAQTTAREIIEDLGASLDVLVAGVGSGGTVTGIARALKPAIPGLSVVGVAARSSYLGANDHGSGRIPGITPDFEAEVFAPGLIDRFALIDPEAANQRARELARSEGLWVGHSSGAIVEAAVSEARERPGAMVLAVLADTGRNTPRTTR